MNELTMDNLVPRLGRLERENKWFKLIGALLIVEIAVMVAMGQAWSSKVAKVVEAERFVLRDTSGRIRGALTVTPQGAAGLVLTDINGKVRVVLGVRPGGKVNLGPNGKNQKGPHRVLPRLRRPTLPVL